MRGCRILDVMVAPASGARLGEERLGEVRAPTLVVHGELDPLVRAEHGEILAAGIPDAQLLLLPGNGHAP